MARSFCQPTHDGSNLLCLCWREIPRKQYRCLPIVTEQEVGVVCVTLVHRDLLYSFPDRAAPRSADRVYVEEFGRSRGEDASRPGELKVGERLREVPDLPSGNNVVLLC